MRRILSAATVLLFAASFTPNSALGQVWEKKQYTEWSKNDCLKILRESPWASTYGAETSLLNRPTAPQVGASGALPLVSVTAVFLSAKPVRQAMVRAQQLEQGHEKLSADQEKSFEERANRFVNTEFPDAILVQVSHVGAQFFLMGILRYLKGQSEEGLKNNLALVVAGKRVLPEQVTISPSGAEIQIVYPRRLNGEPIVTPATKEIRLELIYPVERVSFTFQIKKMMWKGQITF